MCLFSTLIVNPKYKPNKKNQYNPPLCTDERVLYVPIACEECIECRKQKLNSWRTRLLEDIKTNTTGKFITLTFSNESITKYYKLVEQEQNTLNARIDLQLDEKQNTKRLIKISNYGKDNEAATLAVRHFLERWRKKYEVSLRHFFITELGHQNTENIHIHGIVWLQNNTDPLKGIVWNNNQNTWQYQMQEIEDIWQNGWCWKWKKKNGQKINYVSARTINYMVKYINKIDFQHKLYKPIILCTPGVGANYLNTHNATLNKYNETNTKEFYVTDSGHKTSLPIYYRNKLYTETEREKLWIQRLEKNQRYICGEKIDVSKNDKQYWNILRFHQNRNNELGYGNGKTDWSRERYEHEIRALKQAARNKNTS